MRGTQTNRGRRWEYLLFTWKTLGAGRARSARSAPRPATSAAAVLAWRGGGGGGADMELRAPRGLPRRALCGEQGKTRRAAGGGKEQSKCPATGRKAPCPKLPSQALLAEKGEFSQFYSPLRFLLKNRSVESQAHRFFSYHFGDLLSWERVNGLAHPE